MRLPSRATGMCLLAVLMLPFAAGAQNVIKAIEVQEGPNNTVISIRGTDAPTFTVFKLLDPVRLLVDVSGSQLDSKTTANVQVRNGVLHDIESVQFDSRGRTVTRVVIGFDLEATYTVKADGNTIRVLVDGAERRLPQMSDEQTREALKRAKVAVEAEKALREKLQQARAREQMLASGQKSALAEQKRLADELARVRAEAARLKAQLQTAQNGRSAGDALRAEAATKAEQRAQAAAAKEAAARARVKALETERVVLQKERDALKTAVDAAAARKEALSKALAAEESRRKAAQRAREEEEALVRVARRLRQSEEARTSALKKLNGSEKERTSALASLRKTADDLRKKSEASAAEVVSLKAQLADAKKKDHTGRVNALEASLKRAEKSHEREVASLRSAQKAAQTRASKATTEYEAAKKDFQTRERTLKSQMAEKSQALKRQTRANKTLQTQLSKRDAAIATLKAKDKARLKAEKALDGLRKERIATQQKLVDLDRAQARLTRQVDSLTSERDALRAAAKAGTDVARIEAIVAKKRAQVADAESRLTTAKRDAKAATKALSAHQSAIVKVRRELANEKADLAAVLNQKKVFAREIAELEKRRTALNRDVVKTERTLASLRTSMQSTEQQLSSLQLKRQAEQQKVADLKASIKDLRAEKSAAGDRAALERLLADRRAEVKRLQGALASAKKSNQVANREMSDLDKQLDAALKKARAEAQKSAEGRKRLKQLEKFVAAQKRQINTLEKNDTSADLARAEREVSSLKAELSRMKKSGASDAKANRLATDGLRRDLAAARKSGAALEGRLATANKELAARQTRLKSLEAALAAEKTARRAADRELATAATKIQRLVRDRSAAQAEVARLETALDAAEASGDAAASLKTELKAARKARKVAEGRLANEQARRKADRVASERKLAQVTAERDTLERRVAANLKALKVEGRSGKATGKKLAKVEAELAAAQDKIARLDRELATATVKARSAGKLARTMDQLTAAKAALKSERTRAQSAERRAETAERALTSTRKKLDVAQSEVTALEGQLAAAEKNGGDTSKLRRRLASAQAEVATLRSDLATERSSAQDVARQLKAEKKASGELARALKSVKKAREAADKRVLRLEQSLAAAQAEGKGASVVARELKSARKEAETLGAQVATLRSANETLTQKNTDLTRKTKSLDSALTAMTNARNLAQKQVARLETSLSSARANGKQTAALQREAKQAAKLAGELEQTRSALATAKSERDRLSRDLAVERTNRKRLEGALETVTGARDAASARVARLEKELVDARKSGGDTSGLQARLETAQAETQRLNRELTTLRADLTTANGDLASANRRVTALEQDKATAGAEVARLEKALQNAKRDGKSTQALNDQLAAAKEAKKTLEVRLVRLERQVADMSRELSSERERVAALRKAADRPAAAGPATADASVRVKNVTFGERENVSKVRIELDGNARYEVVERSNQRVVLVIDRARIPRALERRLDTSDFYGPVKMVSTFADPDDPSKVRVVVELNDSVRNTIARKGNHLEWSFYNGQHLENGDRMVATRKPASRPVRYEPTAVGGDRTLAPPNGGGAGGGGGGTGVVVPGGGVDFGVLNPFPRKKKSRRRYKGQKINLTIKDADIQQVLTFLAREGGVNIVASDGVQGLVTVHLKEVPWDLALDVILKSRGLDYVVEDGVYRVAPVDVIAAEFEKEVNKRKQLNELKQLQVQLVAVNYADAEQLSERVRGILSEKGTVGVDARTNTLIIKDIEEHVIAAEDLVRRLDTQTPQVLIEARIVEASSNFSEDIGIQWGGNYTASPAFGNSTGLVFPAILGIAGAADDATAPTNGLLSNQPRFAVNLPAAVGAGSGGGIGLTLGTLSGSGSLSVRLGAAEERGSVKIISSPRVATLDNNEATISQGISIPISVVSSLGVNTQFFNADLSLRVTPQVTQDGNVNLTVNISKNEPNFGQTGANGNPSIERKEAQTRLLVRDGDTAVIGGIYTRNTSQSYRKIPGLGDIPFLGWLFKSRTQSDSRTEMILFITPRIINRSASRVRVD